MIINESKIKVETDNINKRYILFYDNCLVSVPNSIAIILDGNGRYAEKNNIPRKLGHKAGCEALEIILEETVKLGIKYLTVYAFSTENWKRSEDEINSLFELFFIYLSKIEKKAMSNNVRVAFIGDIYKFPEKLFKECDRISKITKNNTKCLFSIAFNYGSRDEIVRTIKRLNNSGFDFKNLTEEIFSKNLDTCEIEDPDLLIRTSGEMRLSNFLLWQIAYTEIYITDKLWPEFNKIEYYKSIISFNNRKRRFGGRKN